MSNWGFFITHLVKKQGQYFGWHLINFQCQYVNLEQQKANNFWPIFLPNKKLRIVDPKLVLSFWNSHDCLDFVTSLIDFELWS